jgi:threonine 3-dehydrogenase
VLAENEVLIAIKYASLCGTDLHIYKWDAWAAGRTRPPYIVGHEMGGEVVAVGKQVSSVCVGDFVAAETHIVCNKCLACRTGNGHLCHETKIIGVDCAGCFAEYIKLPEANLWRLDEKIPLTWAPLMEPMGNAVHALFSQQVAGRTVAVIGCGPLGLLSILVARAMGAQSIIAVEPHPERLELARKMGANFTISPGECNPEREIADLTAGLGVDILLEMSGNDRVIAEIGKYVRPGGKILLVGLPVKPVTIDLTNDIIFKGIVVQGIIGRLMYKTWEQTSNLLKSGLVDLDKVITHRFTWDRYEEAFALMEKGNCGKILLEF